MAQSKGWYTGSAGTAIHMAQHKEHSFPNISFCTYCEYNSSDMPSDKEDIL